MDIEDGMIDDGFNDQQDYMDYLERKALDNLFDSDYTPVPPQVTDEEMNLIMDNMMDEAHRQYRLRILYKLFQFYQSLSESFKLISDIAMSEIDNNSEWNNPVENPYEVPMERIISYDDKKRIILVKQLEWIVKRLNDPEFIRIINDAVSNSKKS
jgi:hypothetical protein